MVHDLASIYLSADDTEQAEQLFLEYLVHSRDGLHVERLAEREGEGEGESDVDGDVVATGNILLSMYYSQGRFEEAAQLKEEYLS